jgi:hypothetical protein
LDEQERTDVLPWWCFCESGISDEIVISMR